MLRARPAAALLLVLFSLTFAAPAHAANATSRPSVRHSAVFARFDSLQARGANDELERWLADLSASPAAAADTDLRIVADAHRAAFLAIRGRREDAQRLAAPGIARAAAAHDTLLLCRALLSHALGDVLAGEAHVAAPELRRLLAASRAARLPRYEGQARLDQAFIDLLAERHDAAERGYRAALRLLSPQWDGTARRVAQVGLGRALVHGGRYDEARTIYSQVITAARAANDAYDLAAALNNLAALELQHGDPALAVPAYEQSLELQRRLGHADEQLVTLTNLASVHFRLEEPVQALAQLESGRALLAARIRPATRMEYYLRMGMVLRALQRWDDGLEQTRLAWAVADTFHLRPEPALVSERALALAHAGHVADAVKSLDAWATLVAQTRVPDDPDLMQVRSVAARVLSMSGDQRGAIRRLEAILADVGEAQAPARALSVHGYLADVRALAGDTAGAREEVLATMRAASFGGPVSTDPMWTTRGSDAGSLLWADWLALLARPLPGEDAAERLRFAFDRYHALELLAPGARAAGTRAVGLSELQGRLLAPGELLLEIVPGVDSSLVFAVSRDVARFYRIPGANAAGERARQFRELAQQTQPEVAPMRQALAREWGANLLAPLARELHGLRRLLVIEGASAQEFAWPLLVAPDAPQPLVERFETVNLPSLVALAQLRAHHDAGAAHTLAILANSVDGKGRRLAGVAEETRWLDARYAECSVNAPRSRAEVARALAKIGAADVVHISAHFDTDHENPWRSGILLGDPARADAYLRVQDLVPVRIQARLAVLTGCTALQSDHETIAGERGLAGAFLRAGARAVIGARWPIPDADGKALVQALYPALERGLSAGEALRQAQLALRRNPATADPLHWAGFTLLGDPLVTAKLPRRSLFGIVP